jgi:prophage regulatory protein
MEHPTANLRLTSSPALKLMAAAGDADPVLNKRETAALAGFSVATLYREVKRGTFPKPIKLSPNRVGWAASTIRAWRDTRSSQ